MATIGVKAGASREDLLRLCMGERIPDVRAARSIPSHESGITLVWPTTTATGLPHLVVVANEEARVDLIAWIATYVGAYVPFTAHCRIECMESLPVPPSEDDLPIGFQLASVACVMLETVAVNDAGLTVRDCPNTYSYCLARAVALGYGVPALIRIAQEYDQVMCMAGQELRRRQAMRFRVAWQVLGEVYGSPSRDVRNGQIEPLIRACKELSESGSIGAATLRQLAPQLPGVESLVGISSWTIEDRVTLFGKLIEVIGTSENLNAGFVLGYALSRVSSGSLSHIRLAERAENYGISVVPWYGLCAGLHPNATAAQLGDSSVAVRVLREVARPFRLLKRPRCDISSREIEMFLQEGGEAFRGALSGLGSALVELAPGVETGVPIVHRTTKSRSIDERNRRERMPLVERQLPLAGIGDRGPLDRISYHLSEVQIELARLRSLGRK